MQFLKQRTNPAYSPNEQALKSLVSTCQFKMVIPLPPSLGGWQSTLRPQLGEQQMDIASGNRKPAGQIRSHFEHGRCCLLNSTGASCEGDEKRERSRDTAEGLRDAH